MNDEKIWLKRSNCYNFYFWVTCQNENRDKESENGWY